MFTENDDILNISCAIDNAFLNPLSVMLVSLLETHKKYRVKIHLFSADLTEDNVIYFHNLITLRYHQLFEFYKVNKNIFLKFKVNNRISHAAYYRIIMPNLINSDVNKFLYLDADVIIAGDISGLFKLNLNDKFFAAVDDIAAIDWGMAKKHSIPDGFQYFNSGVMLIDKKKWLEFDASERVIKYLNENQKICDYHDQDGLNGALYLYRYKLPPIWNQQLGIYFIKKEILWNVYGKDNCLEAISKPLIIHFNGVEKPWNYVSSHPMQGLYNKYSQKVNLDNHYNEISLKKWLKKNIAYSLLGWEIVNKYYYYKTRP
jgi:lipopolysaccharide biosynthesis glycosyltransferase